MTIQPLEIQHSSASLFGSATGIRKARVKACSAR